MRALVSLWFVKAVVCQSSGVYMRALVVYGLSKQWSVYEGSS